MTDDMFGPLFEDDPDVQELKEERRLQLYQPDISRRKRFVERALDRFINCQSSLIWLQNALDLRPSFDLTSMILSMELDGSAAFYGELRVIPKSGGGKRIIISPGPELMLVQKRINRLLQQTFPRPDNIFGYRGGNCLQVAQRHAGWPSTLKFDIKDAFFQVGWSRVKSAIHHLPESGFSGTVSRWIARLCTYSPSPPLVSERLCGLDSFLPQGAPTSPVCFDLACKKLDRKLGQIAERVGGIVSRYADNYYFSMPTSRISPKLERMIMCDVQRKGFPIHKVRKVGKGELCRILGYNLVNDRISNTRGFCRKLRGALYVLRTRIDRGLPSHDAWLRVRGCMGFAVNLPNQLQEAYQYCESKIASL